MARIDKVQKTVGYNLRLEKGELKLIENALSCYLNDILKQIETEDDDSFYKVVDELYSTIKNYKR